MSFFFEKKRQRIEMVISPSSGGVRQKTLYQNTSTLPETHESGDFQTIFQDLTVEIFDHITFRVFRVGKSTQKHGVVHKNPYFIWFQNPNSVLYGSINYL